MDAVDFDNVKAEKANAMRRYNRLQSIARLFRLAEVCLALVFLSWTCTRLPLVVKISGEFIRRLAGIVSNPLFVFVICNGIIAALIANSGRFSGENNAAGDADSSLYDEFVRNNENRAKPLGEDAPREEIVYEDKQVIFSQPNAISPACESHSNRDVSTVSDSDPEVESQNRRVYRRSKSEKLAREKSEGGILRRSETEKFQERENLGEKIQARGLYPEDELSNEEFQRTIEEFIAKQLKFRRQESLSVVLQSQT